MTKGTGIQPLLTKEEILAEYAKEGFNPLFTDFFWDKYLALHTELNAYENTSDDALIMLKNSMRWYDFYKKIGHPESWCQKAWEYGLVMSQNRDINLENDADCLAVVYIPEWRESSDVAIAEFKRHCDFIGPFFGKSQVYMQMFYEWGEDLDCGSSYLSHFADMEHAYQSAIAQGKDDNFAYYYATLGEENGINWKLAEQRERLQNEDCDGSYIDEYLCQYQKNLLEEGFDREFPGQLPYSEEKTIAYMKGWDYCRKNGLERRFVDIYTDVYMNAAHPNNPQCTPWDRFDEYVLNIAIRRYNGEHINTEPWRSDYSREFEDMVEMNMVNGVRRKSRNEQILETAWDMMYPDGVGENEWEDIIGDDF